ncbi:hypothetical protein BV22DRAFT_1031245 [Leucogyrophana mollusca]|uniref:Uncharacterized protein n=1 Tax=Leucogyrophana mollusca TaxID=85980 RepID=A0ACB8BSV1_9AGAM|nr:hypothetical protein BV22DRAFT_1031245 [Leucogyrophana mollusca]
MAAKSGLPSFVFGAVPCGRCFDISVYSPTCGMRARVVNTPGLARRPLFDTRCGFRRIAATVISEARVEQSVVLKPY